MTRIALKRKEVASLLGISQAAMRELAESDDGPPFVQVGKTLKLYGTKQLEEWLDGDKPIRPPKLALSLDEAAESFGVSVETFTAQVRNSDNPPPFIEFGKAFVWPIDGLKNWLKENAKQHTYKWEIE